MISHVYLWTDGLGHISLCLSNDVYISYWPKDPMKKLVKAIKGGEAEWYDDIETEILEQGLPQKTSPILDLDVERITQWWEELKQSQPKWNLLKHSCSNIVYQALCEGNEWFRGRKEGTPSTPEAVFELVEKGFTTNTSYKITCGSICKPSKKPRHKGDESDKKPEN